MVLRRGIELAGVLKELDGGDSFCPIFRPNRGGFGCFEIMYEFLGAGTPVLESLEAVGGRRSRFRRVRAVADGKMSYSHRVYEDGEVELA